MFDMMTEIDFYEAKRTLIKGFALIGVGMIIWGILAAVVGAKEALPGLIFIPWVPYVWCKIPLLVVGPLTFFVKAVLSLIAGWIVTPVTIVLNVARVVAYRRSVIGHTDDA